MSSKELREKAIKELSIALGSRNKAVGHLNKMDSEFRGQQEIACMVNEMIE